MEVELFLKNAEVMPKKWINQKISASSWQVYSDIWEINNF